MVVDGENFGLLVQVWDRRSPDTTGDHSQRCVLYPLELIDVVCGCVGEHTAPVCSPTV